MEKGRGEEIPHLSGRRWWDPLRSCPADASRLLLDLSQIGRVDGEIGEHHPLLVVVLAQDLVVAQEEAIAHAEPGEESTDVFEEANNEKLIPCFS